VSKFVDHCQKVIHHFLIALNSHALTEKNWFEPSKVLLTANLSSGFVSRVLRFFGNCSELLRISNQNEAFAAKPGRFVVWPWIPPRSSEHVSRGLLCCQERSRVFH
jgi:hypothetical protein